MSMTKKIKIMMVEADLTQKQLADRLNTSQPNLAKKFKMDNWREDDLKKIAEACGYTYEGYFKKNDKVI